MNTEIITSITELKRGDIVFHVISGESYIIDGIYSDYAIGMQTIRISNPNEWLLIEKI